MRYLIIIMTIVFAFGCTPNDTTTKKVESKNENLKKGYSSYTHPFDIYKMNAPDLWKREFNDKTETIILTNPPIDGRVFDEKITIVTRRGGMFYDKDQQKMISKEVEIKPIIKEFMKSINKSKGFKLIESSDENLLSKNKKATAVYEFEDENGLILKTQTELINNGKIALFLHYTAAKNTFDETYPTFQNVLKSIQFLEK